MVTASIGTAVYRVDEQNYRDLIKQADIAMYLAKARIHSSISSAHPGMQN